MAYPAWFHDGQLSILRRQLQNAYADLADAEAFAPPGPADDGVDHARMLTLRAETLFATRIQEILTDLNTAAHPKKF